LILEKFLYNQTIFPPPQVPFRQQGQTRCDHGTPHRGRELGDILGSRKRGVDRRRHDGFRRIYRGCLRSERPLADQIAGEHHADRHAVFDIGWRQYDPSDPAKSGLFVMTQYQNSVIVAQNDAKYV
jgi:hypothetical protein